MAPQALPARSLLVRHLLLWPLAGGASAAGAFGLLMRPVLPWPSWLLDISTIACGAMGILLGGALGFRRWPIRAHVPATAPQPRAILAAVAAALLVVVLVGGPSAPYVLAGAGFSAALWLVVARRRQRR